MAYQKSVETKHSIRTVAERLFVEKGYHNVTMHDISEAAGVVRSSLYYYYKNKEAIADHIFDDIMEKIILVAEDLNSNKADVLLQVLVFHILYFRHLALNEATKVIFYDVIDYTEYNSDQLAWLQRHPLFKKVELIYGEYNVPFDQNQRLTFLYIWNASAKALFKGILRGSLNYSLREAMDYFMKQMFLNNLNIPQSLYQEKLEEAFRLCEHLDLTTKNLV
jgi:AcrR family transcriptional regulator